MPQTGSIGGLQGVDRNCEFRRADLGSIAVGLGSLIRHASSHRPTLSVRPLTISMVQLSLKALLMTDVRSTPLLPAGLEAATFATVLLAPIAAAADPKHSTASLGATNPLT